MNLTTVQDYINVDFFEIESLLNEEKTDILFNIIKSINYIKNDIDMPSSRFSLYQECLEESLNNLFLEIPITQFMDKITTEKDNSVHFFENFLRLLNYKNYNYLLEFYAENINLINKEKHFYLLYGEDSFIFYDFNKNFDFYFENLKKSSFFDKDKFIENRKEEFFSAYSLEKYSIKYNDYNLLASYKKILINNTNELNKLLSINTNLCFSKNESTIKLFFEDIKNHLNDKNNFFIFISNLFDKYIYEPEDNIPKIDKNIIFFNNLLLNDDNFLKLPNQDKLFLLEKIQDSFNKKMVLSLFYKDIEKTVLTSMIKENNNHNYKKRL